MKKWGFICIGLALVWNASCQNELIEYEQGDLKVSIEQGEAWLHDFPLFWGIKVKNPPQIAVWLEDTAGNYLSTVYVTHKIATQSWQSAGGNRRKEALPHWCHRRGVQYKDGLYLPTKDDPLTDGISGATPRKSFTIRLSPVRVPQQFVVKVEVNHSTDFNACYPKSARVGEANYSGGKEGSGQPALVWEARINLASEERLFEAVLLGHSSPDGSSGDLSGDLSGLTSALAIVKRIVVHVQ